MNKSGPNILLSICIPTFNRADYLRDAIKYILPAVDKMNEIVELIISDNCSTDDTSDILKELPVSPWIHCVRNETNVGALKNGLKCLNLAKGEYVWFVGDDDIIRPEGLNHLVQVVSDHENLDYFVVNAITLIKEQRNKVNDIINYDAISKQQNTKFKSLSDKEISSFNEYIDPNFDPIFLGAMMCNVIRRSVWQQGVTGIDANAQMGSVVGTYLVCSVLARTMVGKPSFYVGFPCSIAFWGHQEWMGFMPIIFAYTFYAVLDCYEENGVETWRIEKCRRYLHYNSAMAIYRLAFFRSLPGKELFSFRSHLHRYWKHYELWRGLIITPLKYIRYNLLSKLKLK
jgi:glycosyltransferase involved in cell wall biosynthesis